MKASRQTPSRKAVSAHKKIAPQPARKIATRVPRQVKQVKKVTKTRLPSIQNAQRSFSSSLPVSVNSPRAPKAVGPYVHAKILNNTVYVSGQLPLDPSTMKFVSDDDVAAQAKQCLINMQYILEDSGSDLQHIAKCNILLTDMANFGTVNKVYESFFPANPPARVCFAVKQLPLNALVEIECIAGVNPNVKAVGVQDNNTV